MSAFWSPRLRCTCIQPSGLGDPLKELQVAIAELGEGDGVVSEVAASQVDS